MLAFLGKAASCGAARILREITLRPKHRSIDVEIGLNRPIPVRETIPASAGKRRIMQAQLSVYWCTSCGQFPTERIVKFAKYNIDKGSRVWCGSCQRRHSRHKRTCPVHPNIVLGPITVSKPRRIRIERPCPECANA